jgi:O-succinylbenzoic acid--CoA ligase
VSVTHDPVQFWSHVDPTRPAIRRGGRAWTYRELDFAVQESADALFEHGLGAGEHVSLGFDPSHAMSFVVAWHALHRIGLLPVPIGARLTPEEREELRRRAMVDLALTSESVESEDEASRAAVATTHAPPPSTPILGRRLDDSAALCFTSGTTGEPRAAVLTHGNFFWSAIASARNLGVRARDLWLCCLPLHHVAGLSILSRSAHYGTEVLLHDRFDADAVSEAIDREGVTLLSLVPPMLERLLSARGGRPFPATLRAALVGGGPIPVALLEEAASLRMVALPTYGLTEATSQVTTLSPREWPEGLDSAGRPLAFVHVEIHDAEGRAVAPGEEGEIVVRGPTVMAAYYGSRETDAAAWNGRWLRTGDHGAWDPAGRLVVLDRRADRMVVGGENVSPAEVERVLRLHPSILDVAVVGLPSGSRGHEIAVAVTLREGRDLTLDELRRHAGAALSDFKLPRRLAIADELPRSASGKLLRSALRDWFLAEMAQKETP